MKEGGNGRRKGMCNSKEEDEMKIVCIMKEISATAAPSFSF
jgi:hypothetical protein